MIKKILAALTAIALLGTLIGGFIYYEDRNDSKYATLTVVMAFAESLRLTDMRLDQKIVHDKIDRANSQLRQIKISCKTNDPIKMNPDAQRNYYQLKQDLINFNRELEQINKKGKNDGN